MAQIVKRTPDKWHRVYRGLLTNGTECKEDLKDGTVCRRLLTDGEECVEDF